MWVRWPKKPRRQALLRGAGAIGAVAIAAAVGIAVLGPSDEDDVASESVSMTLPQGPGEQGTVDIDATFYLPHSTPAPAVLLAHGFGGSKDSVANQARQLARDGFAVLAYSARGFGRSTGLISLNDPDREVADARALVSWLATRTEVQLDAPGDPRVGVAGGSYGGALALMLGGSDSRIDAIAAGITWNDLGQALFPNYAEPLNDEPLNDAAGLGNPAPQTPSAPTYAGPGVLKRQWAGVFFGVGAASVGSAQPAGDLVRQTCGRFAPIFCEAYTQAAVTGYPSPELLAILRSHSPASVTRNIKAPTLLVQGERDTLFGLDQADANAREIAENGTPVQVRWFNGGHDGDAGRADGPIRAFLDEALPRNGLLTTRQPSSAADEPTFGFALPGTLNEQGQIPSRRMTARDYPGLHETGATPRTAVQLSGMTQSPQIIVRPPGAAPPAVSSVPGLGTLSSALSAAGGGAIGLDPPGQTATFSSGPLPQPLTITGSATVDLRVHSFAAPNESVLFAKLYDVSGEGRRTLPGGAVAAMRLPESADGAPRDIRVTLAGIAYQVPAGHRIEIAIGTTDQAYAVPLQPAIFSVALADSRLLVPSVPAVSSGRSVPLGPLIGIGVIVACVALIVATAVIRSRRRTVIDADLDLADTPLVVSDLAKVYPNGFRAVDGVSFRVEQGQVLGLLGPNGAGKTTTLRMLMGLIAPASGEIRVFGHKIGPGSPVLSRIGAFIEGPGLLPHLTGIENLRLFWQATGRPDEDSHLDDVLAIADLGDAVHRKVRSYSHGMKQRLAIAQSMLGLPDLLVLDEPTNGLDPPQIRTTRDVLIGYARGGRTVVVSSHLLAEVEQTCTHVVVMNLGKVISAGPVRELVSAGGPTEVRVDDAVAAAAALSGLTGLGTVIATDGDNPRLRIDLGSVLPADVVSALVNAGIAVSGVTYSTRLEDVFLALVHDPRAVSSADIAADTKESS